MRIIDKELPEHFDELDVDMLEAYKRLGAHGTAVELVTAYKIVSAIIDLVDKSGADIDYSSVIDKYMFS
jgi:hypothetical protein